MIAFKQISVLTEWIPERIYKKKIKVPIGLAGLESPSAHAGISINYVWAILKLSNQNARWVPARGSAKHFRYIISGAKLWLRNFCRSRICTYSQLHVKDRKIHTETSCISLRFLKNFETAQYSHTTAF